MRRGCAILFRVLQEDFSENVSKDYPTLDIRKVGITGVTRETSPSSSKPGL